MAATVTDCGNVKIITQVVQNTDSGIAAVATEPGTLRSQPTPAQVENFKNTLPKAFGATQIVLGAIQISFGIALTAAQHPLLTITVKSSVYFWIGILLLISGSFLVEMEKRERAWLVKACFYSNVLVSVAALCAVFLHGVEISQEYSKERQCSSRDWYCSNEYKVLIYGLNSVFIILSFLELSIAVVAMITIKLSTKRQLYRQMTM